ncbi:predicted protein [Streptomyces albidoflavus]|nr:predicted protein [Streptomyces albidoflavus]
MRAGRRSAPVARAPGGYAHRIASPRRLSYARKAGRSPATRDPSTRGKAAPMTTDPTGPGSPATEDDPLLRAPEGDTAEQREPADPDEPDTAEEALEEVDPGTANEADVVEQLLVVEEDEDDYR